MEGIEAYQTNSAFTSLCFAFSKPSPFFLSLSLLDVLLLPHTPFTPVDLQHHEVFFSFLSFLSSSKLFRKMTRFKHYDAERIRKRRSCDLS